MLEILTTVFVGHEGVLVGHEGVLVKGFHCTCPAPSKRSQISFSYSFRNTLELCFESETSHKLSVSCPFAAQVDPTAVAYAVSMLKAVRRGKCR